MGIKMIEKTIKAGSWVEITKKDPKQNDAVHPYEMKVRGYLTDDVLDSSEVVTIETPSGRTETGIITAAPPLYDLPMGEASQELASIGRKNRLILKLQQKQRLQ